MDLCVANVAAARAVGAPSSLAATSDLIVHSPAPSLLPTSNSLRPNATTAPSTVVDTDTVVGTVNAHTDTDTVVGTVDIDTLVAAFRAHRPATLTPYPGVREALAELRAAGLELAVVTDGDVGVQRAKLDALGLGDVFAVVVLSDALGRGCRKPHPAPFVTALAGLGSVPEHAVFVGDRPDKDVIGADRVGIRAVRVITGEYSALPDPPETWFSAPTFAEATRRILQNIEGVEVLGDAQG